MQPTANRAFWRALHSLSHPLTIGAVLLLLLNDHWLRWGSPSWLTGKLGDFVWLIFAPLIAALFFTCILPRRIRYSERIIGLLAFLAVGTWFTLAKTTPLVHGLTLNLWHTLTGWDGALLMDASDLLTLPGLLVGWWIWTHADDAPLSLRPFAYAVFALGIVLTLANEPGSPSRERFGVRCLVMTENGQLLVRGAEYNEMYVASNGGLAWQRTTDDEVLWQALSDNCPSRPRNGVPFTLTDPANPQIQFRFRQPQAIDRSVDSGKTWTLELDLSALEKNIYRFYQSTNEAAGTLSRVVENPGPFDAVFDPLSDNLVVAMGEEGILVRTPEGDWQWVTVGEYHPTVNQPNWIPDILTYEIVLAIVMGLLTLVSLLPTVEFGCVTRALIVVSWAFWLGGVLLPPPNCPTANSISPNDFTIPSIIFACTVGFVFLRTIIIEISRGRLSPKYLRFRLMLVAVSVLLFLLPYILWARGTIPYHSTASTFALLSAALTLIGGGLYLKWLPLLKKSKDVAEDAADSPSA